jgi:SAM-dependent methyltransferase
MKDTFIYTKTMVRFYDIIYDAMLEKQSRDYYVERVTECKGPVLEIGTGTGRIFLRALSAGADIYGIDISINMLNVLKSKMPENQHYRLHYQDVRGFKLDNKFKLIIAPFRMFSHLIEIEDQLSALNSIRGHLADDGRFIFDVFVPKVDRIDGETREDLVIDLEYEKGRRLQRFDIVTPDYINQIQHITFKFYWDEENCTHQESVEFPFRYFFRYELEHLLARADLKIEEIYGDFYGHSLDKAQKEFVVVCRK